MFNVDRWTIYTLQRLYPNRTKRMNYKRWCGEHTQRLTSKQNRRMRKHARKGDTSLIVML